MNVYYLKLRIFFLHISFDLGYSIFVCMRECHCVFRLYNIIICWSKTLGEHLHVILPHISDHTASSRCLHKSITPHRELSSLALIRAQFHSKHGKHLCIQKDRVWRSLLKSFCLANTRTLPWSQLIGHWRTGQGFPGFSHWIAFTSGRSTRNRDLFEALTSDP